MDITLAGLEYDRLAALDTCQGDKAGHTFVMNE